MRSIVMVAVLSAATATAAAAQTPTHPGRAYVEANGGFATTTDKTSGAVAAEVGVEVVHNLFVVGNIGSMQNVQPSVLEPTVDASVAAAGAAGLSVLGDPRVAARYATGGLRYEIPRWARATPYVSGGIGYARLTPSARFTYQTGATTFTGGTATAGEDATADVETNGYFTAPASSNALMVSVGAGVKIPIGARLVGDVGYNVSRIASDTPVTPQGLQFGIAYRF